LSFGTFFFWSFFFFIIYINVNVKNYWLVTTNTIKESVIIARRFSSLSLTVQISECLYKGCFTLISLQNTPLLLIFDTQTLLFATAPFFILFIV